ncbi:hypothetical protein Desor_1016 [Desulfosporosinus orientis DSM 765]|uniref:Uncharacterized protein n=1 Tax=Desulfosporosinus orientis (strain ATCC 19365 / DSM 765 / NCIMB 8382 / VKM B-1628 / Singapore I) TaxID=768706 RepID=G7W844_DESOD|nr:hypothetical protein [Desulfosporosinus orientis]AET66690.1 hypothetical protein Desor_1016 [Desulfosporosinus orientis DSM 765]
MLSLNKANKAAISQVSFVWRGLSLHSLKLIFVGILACHFVFFLFLWQPVYNEISTLKEAKLYWQQVIRTGLKSSAEEIPGMDQLPSLIEQCCDDFSKSGVDVASFNVERFGERRAKGKGTRIDYALVRLRLLGQWQDILSALKELEGDQGFKIQIQEVLLTEEGGNTLLQIYFKTGDREG